MQIPAVPGPGINYGAAAQPSVFFEMCSKQNTKPTGKSKSVYVLGGRVWGQGGGERTDFPGEAEFAGRSRYGWKQVVD